MKRTLIAALLLAATAVHAQTPSADERRAQLRDAYQDARQVCKDKQDVERRNCIAQEMCAQAKEPAKCHDMVSKHGETLHKALEACKDKQGAELKTCLRDQRRPKS